MSPDRNNVTHKDLAQPAQSQPGTHRRGRWRRRLLAVGVACLILYLFRSYLLQSTARLLIVDEPAPEAACLLILDRDCSARAVQLFRDSPALRILVIETKPSRLQRLGIRPGFDEETRRDLVARGLPAPALSIIPGQARNDWDRARCLRDWLRRQEPTSVTVLCHRFHSRKIRTVFDRVLGPELRGRVHVTGVAESEYDETNWWRHKKGILDWFAAYTRLAYVWVCGEATEEWREWNPDDYERTLGQAP
jgi:hypothetical protein